MAKLKRHPAEQYAQDVIDGKIAANIWVIKACLRYFDDIQNAKSKGWYFDQETAQAYIDFIEMMPLTKGKLAGQPLKLEPWQQFIIWNTYGWKKTKNNYRRFDKVTVCVPKKNGKTELIAAIADAHLVLDNEFGAEIYMAATARDQARICFKAAKTMVELNPDLREILDPLKTGIFYEANNSSIKAISSEAGAIEGGGASLVIYDEEHEQKDTTLKENLISGQASKPEGLFISISTAGLDKSRPYFQHIKDCYKVLDGVMEEDNHFILIYGVDENDDWRSIDALKKANPNWGVSVEVDKLISEQQEAINKPGKQASFKTKHLNIWTDAEKIWIPSETWRKNAASLHFGKQVHLEDFLKYPCYAGIDLASSIDFTALALLFKLENGKFINFWKYYIPSESEEKRTKRDNLNFKLWADQGFIHITDGNVVDYTYMRNDINALSKSCKFEIISYDPHNSSELVTNLTNDGLPMNKFPQGINYMSEPTKFFEKLVYEGALLHNDNPVSNWMLSNVHIFTDANENKKPHRGRSVDKIDGIIATINALGGMLQLNLEKAQTSKSPYERRGVRFL